MKIAVSSTGPTLEDNVESRFGRCPYFLVIETDTMNFEAIENPNIALGGGAGIQSAQMMAEKGVSHVLTGNCGPNAFRTFGAAGVQVVTGVTGRVREEVRRFKEGGLEGASSPSVESHFGMSGGAGVQTGQTLRGGSETGMGIGGGMGRGMGGGGGKGRGMGCGGGGGGGRGMGMGRGIGGGGMGRGMGMGGGGSGMGGGAGYGATLPAGITTPPPGNLTKERELDQLKSQARALEEQLNSIRRSIQSVEKGGRAAAALVAAVDPEKCDACGVCCEVCPNSAIQVENIALIKREKCAGCGMCVADCPQGALFLKKA